LWLFFEIQVVPITFCNLKSDRMSAMICCGTCGEADNRIDQLLIQSWQVLNIEGPPLGTGLFV
jgi:hypothetical protein